MKRQFQGYIARHHLLLATLWTFQTINNYIWLKNDTIPLGWDAGFHFLDSLMIFDILRHPSPSIFSDIMNVTGFYPPLVYLIPAPFYALFGRTPDIAVFTMNSIFLAVLMFSVYGIGNKLHSKKAGLLASFIVTMYPIIFGQGRDFMLDVPLASMTSLSVYALLKTCNFRNGKNSVFFGLTLGLGMLTKWTFAVFISGPLLYVLYMSFIEGRGNEGKGSYLNFLLSVLLGLAITSIWYLPSLHTYIDTGAYKAFGEPGLRRPPVFSIWSLSFYFYTLINNQISFPFFLIFAISLLFIFKSKNKKNLIPLFLWILIPYLLLTLIPLKLDRYTIPYLPAVALLSAIGILQMNDKRMKSVAISLVIVIGIFQFFVVSYGLESIPKTIKIDLHYGKIALFKQNYYLSPPLRTEDWKTEEILRAINMSIEREGVYTTVVIPADEGIIPPMVYMGYLNGVEGLKISSGIQTSKIYNADYVLTKNRGFMGLDWMMEDINRTIEIFNGMIDDFELIAQIELPDSELLIYKRIPLGERKMQYLNIGGLGLVLFHKKIDIGVSDDIDYIKDGFHEMETSPDNRTYRWTGETAIVEIPYPKNEGVLNAMLRLSVDSMRPDNVPYAVISVLVNDCIEENFTIKGAEIHSFKIPTECFTSGRLTVKINSNTWTPSIYTDSKETRTLGIAVDWIGLEIAAKVSQ